MCKPVTSDFNCEGCFQFRQSGGDLLNRTSKLTGFFFNRRILYICLLSLIRSVAVVAQPVDDTVKPEPPQLLSVDVIPGTDSVQVFWQPSISKDVEFYVIYQYAGIGWVPVDTSFSAARNHFTVQIPAVLERSVSLSVGAVDSSGNSSPLSNSHVTNFLQLQFDSCAIAMKLSWTGYSAWPDDSVHYVIYKQYAAGFIMPVDTLPEEAKELTDTVRRNALVCYYVGALYSGGLVVRSNRVCHFTHVVSQPAWINADFASVTPEGKVELGFHIDQAGDSVEYVLFRRQPGGRKAPVKQSPFPTGGSLSVEDIPPDILHPWEYTLASLDACLKPVTFSNPATTIVLGAEKNNGNIQLQWNVPRGYRAGVDHYTIYLITGENVFLELARNGPLDTLFSVRQEDFAGQGFQGNVCFVVQAEERSGNPYGTKGISLSNRSCISLAIQFRMPNAFTPNQDGINEEFGPVFDFLPSKYQLIISDSGGTKLFETTNPQERWNGLDRNGKQVLPGVYVWYMRFNNADGKVVEEYGSVAVIYP